MDLLYQCIKPLGIAAYSLFAIVIISGFIRKKFNFSKWVRVHAWLSWAGICLATIHAALVIFLV